MDNKENMFSVDDMAAAEDAASTEEQTAAEGRPASKPRYKKMKKSTKIIIITAAVLVAIIVACVIVVNGMLNQIKHIDKITDIVAPEQEDFVPDEDAGEDTVVPADVGWDDVEAVEDDDLCNILLVGQDRRPGQGRQRSDTMILCSINLKTGDVAMVSFLRDLYVQIPGGYSDNRLNAAYVFGGFDLLKNTLNKNFGVSVDGAFEVDFEGFTKIIDKVGGVDIKLTEKEAKWMKIGTSAGSYHLNGTNALAYARIRKLDSDFGRTNRQRNVLMALFKKVKGRSVSDLMDLANSVLPLLATDMSNSEIVSLTTQVAKMLSTLNVETYHVPDKGEYYNATIRGMMVLVPYRDKIVNRLKTEVLPFGE